MRRGTVSLLSLCLLSGLSLFGCDKRTAEEKGAGYAGEKLGFAQGAADELKERGGTLGQSVGKGVADLVKGVGSGVKDSVTPEVPAEAEPGAIQMGLTVHHAQEGAGDGNSRLVNVYVEFVKAFRGKLQLFAYDAAGTELGRGDAVKELDFPTPAKELLEFRFPGSVRLSHAAKYRVHYVDPVALAVGEGIEGIEASQLQQSGQTVTVYLRFVNKFAGALELRAYNGAGAEIGRSEKTKKLKQAADSAEHFEFKFGAHAPLGQAAKYELR